MLVPDEAESHAKKYVDEQLGRNLRDSQPGQEKIDQMVAFL
jgi:hypothetical protein